MTKKIASRLLKTIRLAIFVFPPIHPGRMGINNGDYILYDRDLLAARNIKKFGLEKQNLLTQ